MDVGLELAAPESPFAVVHQRADERIVDGVPYFEDHQQQREKRGAQADVLRIEHGKIARQREGHVAAEVPRGVSELIAHAELRVSVFVERARPFHKIFPSFARRCAFVP